MSGSASHPRDVFTNVILEIKPFRGTTEGSQNEYLTVDKIGEWKNGQKKALSAVLGASFGPIEMVRVYFLTSTAYWLIVKKVDFLLFLIPWTN